MPATNPEFSGARKWTLSTRAATNGDPIAERKRQKLEEGKNKGSKTVLTQKKVTTTASKNATTTRKAAPKSPSVDVEGSKIDSGDDDTVEGPVPEIIIIGDNKDTTNRGFCSLMKTGWPEYLIPSPHMVSQDVRNVFVMVRKRITKMLQVSSTFIYLFNEIIYKNIK